MDIVKARTKPKDSESELNPFKGTDFLEENTAIPASKNNSPWFVQEEENADWLLYKRAGGFIEYGNDVEADLKRSKGLEFYNPPDLEETDEEDNVYPLSIKYDRIKAFKIAFYRYFFLIIILIICIPSDLYTLNMAKSIDYRTGFWADQIWEESVSMTGITEFSVNTKNCIVYFLENTGSTSSIRMYVSAARGTSVSAPKASTVQGFTVNASKGAVQCYVEIYIPGGVTIPKLSLNYNGDSILDLIIYDHKDGSSWNTPMIITDLSIVVSDSYPNILFENQHVVSSLTVTGTYCACNFNNLKIASMTYTVTVGSLYIVQNSAYTANKVTVSTPYGTHCIAGATVNTVDTNCPNQATRDAGISGTYIDTTTYCKSELYVCSNSAASCPASGTAVSTGQGSFTITQDDGPIEFLISGSTTTSAVSYMPTFDTFTITSQILLTENKNDFSTQTNDPRMYLYEVISPGYKRMWVHSPLRQYVEARPWLLSMLSLSILKPVYYRHTLIHIPDTTCPLRNANNAQQNTLIAEKLEDLSIIGYSESGHIFAQKANDTYYEFEYTAKGDYIQTEIPFLGDGVAILLCLIVSSLLA